MKSSLSILSAAVLSACLALSGCVGHKAVIPPKVLSDIYFDMLVTDQWISDHNDLGPRADTTLIYEPVFNRYGYTTADYDNSVIYYLQYPDKFKEIVQATADRFQSERSRLEGLQSQIRKVEEKNSIYTHYRYKDFGQDSVKWAFGKMKTMIDSILIENKWIISQENTDTLQTR